MMRTSCSMMVLISDGRNGSRMPSMSALRSCSTNSMTIKIWLMLSPTTISSTLTMLRWFAIISVWISRSDVIGKPSGLGV